MKFVADLHLHSKYSRAVSQKMVLPEMANWAKMKGINVLATGDFTHPFWFDSLKQDLKEDGSGLLKLKKPVASDQEPADVSFMLSCEISSIYTQGGRSRRIHTLYMFPTLSSVEKFNNELVKRGANLRSDGRPIVGISAKNLAEIALECDEKALVIPAHIWTPWFSLFGSMSGFDSIEECYGDLADKIYGIETGLSSDPVMNWQIKELANRAILSFSDAHSLAKMGREATVFEASEVTYDSIYKAIVGLSGSLVNRTTGENNPNNPTTRQPDNPRIAFTIEFFPEEGKYHYTGHRDCGVSLSPTEMSIKGDICPECSRKLTIGVMQRVEDLTSIKTEVKPKEVNGVRWMQGAGRPPYVSLVPLNEILAEVLEVGDQTKKVQDQYWALVNIFGTEFNVLLKAELEEIRKVAAPRVAEGIEKVRSGNIVVEPGFDGQFGIVSIWDKKKEEAREKAEEMPEDQLSIFA